jgi:hypothetical protein
MVRLSGQSFHQECTILVLMKLLVNKVDDTDPKPHFTSIITPLPVKSYYGLLTISAVNVNNIFQVFNSKQSNTLRRNATYAILHTYCMNHISQ